jgi:hypothetical protein
MADPIGGRVFNALESLFRGNNNEEDAINTPGRAISSKVSEPLSPERVFRKKWKITFVVALILLESTVELYARIPQKWIYGSEPVPLVRSSSGTSSSSATGSSDLVLILPGAGGADDLTTQLQQKIRLSDSHSGIRRDIEVYDWLPWRGSFVRAAFDSQAVGRSLGKQLAQEFLASQKNGENRENRKNDLPSTTASTPIPMHSLQVIGISVGSFAADSCVKTFRAELARAVEAPESPVIGLTLLDPFTSKGIFGYGWGAKFFGADLALQHKVLQQPGLFSGSHKARSTSTLQSGSALEVSASTQKGASRSVGIGENFVVSEDEEEESASSADVFEVYLNSDDPVPTTNEPIPKAVVVDVTAAASKQLYKPASDHSMHDWPVVWLSQNWETQVVAKRPSLYTSKASREAALVADDARNSEGGVLVNVR